jgi:hypothetical protein
MFKKSNIAQIDRGINNVSHHNTQTLSFVSTLFSVAGAYIPPPKKKQKTENYAKITVLHQRTILLKSANGLDEVERSKKVIT